MTVKEMLTEIKKQMEVDGCTNVYGEPQAIIDLENGRSIVIVHEEEGLEANEQYYSFTLRCADCEYDSFEDVGGAIEMWATAWGSTFNDIEPLLSDMLEFNNADFLRVLDFKDSIEKLSAGDGFIDMTLKMEGKAFNALVSKLDLLTVTGFLIGSREPKAIDGIIEELINYYDINITAAMDVNDSNSMRVVASIANDSEGVYDVEYNLTNSDEYNSLYNEIRAHAQRMGYTIDDYIAMAYEEGGAVIEPVEPTKPKHTQDVLEY